MRSIFIFFCKNIGRVDFSTNMAYLDFFVLNRFMNSIFFNLDMTDIVRCFVAGLLNASHIVIEDFGGKFLKIGAKAEILDNVMKLEDRFGAFVSGINLCLSSATCSDLLTTV